MKRIVCTMVLCLALAPLARAADVLKEGNWRLSYAGTTAVETVECILKLDKKDGKWTGNLVAASPRATGLTLENLTVDGDKIHITVKLSINPRTGIIERKFEGSLKGDGKVIRGSYGDANRLMPGFFTKTDADMLEAADVSIRRQLPAPMQKSVEIGGKAMQFQLQAMRTTDAAERTKLQRQAQDANREAEAAIPGLYKEVLEKHSDHPCALDAALGLLRTAARNKPTYDDVRAWTQAADKAAGHYGNRYQREIALQIAEMLNTQGGFAPIALDSAAKAEKGLSEKEPVAKQIRVLTALARAQQIAGKSADAQTTNQRLERDVLTKNADNPAVFDAVLALLRNAARNKATVEQVRGLVRVAEKAAAAKDEKTKLEMPVQVAEILTNQAGYAAVALELAGRAEKALTEKDSTDQQVRVLTALMNAQKKSGKAADANVTETRVEKLESVLDKEYIAKLPKIDNPSFEGRKGQSNRVAVMELFTGAQCPPCVAADMAFDQLEKAYKPTDLVLIQYHLHIPGPDPLTNADTVARATYYKANSTPTTLFNGSKAAGGGGAIAAAQKKLNDYRGVIDPLLEKDAGANLRGSATRQGDKLSIEVQVSDLKDADNDKRLRLILVEDTVRYVGGNRLRFHHHVVRAMPGGANGVAISGKDFKHTATMDLGGLRDSLHKYLDEYANTRPFPKPDRPMAMKHLKVIAIVQDDKTQEILQGLQMEVAGDIAE